MAPHWAVWLLAAGLWGLGIGAEVWWNLVPRKTVSSGGECLKSEETDQFARRGLEWLLREEREMPRGCPLECASFILLSGSRHTDACDPAF